MPTRRCRPSRPDALRTAPEPLLSAHDALEVVLLATDQDRAQVLALLLDDRHVGGHCMVVDDITHADRVLDVAGIVVAAAEQASSLDAVVLASVRPDARLDDRDLDRWFELCDVLERGGLRLLDWFVVGDGMVASLRELTGCPDEWTPPALR